MGLSKLGIGALVVILGCLNGGCVFTSSSEFSDISSSSSSNGGNEVEIRDLTESSTSPAHLAGKWDARSRHGGGNVDDVQVKIISHTGVGSSRESMYGSSRNEGFQKLFRGNGPVHVTVRREAGTLTFDGTISDGHGTGDVTFDADPSYLAEMGRLTGETIAPRRALELAMVDLDLAYAQRIAGAGYKFSTGDLIGLKFAGVTAEHAKRFHDAGYQFSADDLRELRFGGVDADAAKKFKDAGYDFSANDLRSLRFGGVDADEAARFRRAGYALGADDLRRLRFTGVPAGFAAELARAGYHFTPEELTRLRFTGVSDEYAVALKRAGYDLSAEQLARLRMGGVTADFAAELVVPGKRNLSAEELIRLRQRGIDSETIRTLRQ